MNGLDKEIEKLNFPVEDGLEIKDAKIKANMEYFHLFIYGVNLIIIERRIEFNLNQLIVIKIFKIRTWTIRM